MEQNKLEFLRELEDIQQNAIDGGKKAMGAYGNFRLPGSESAKKEKEEEEYTTLKEKMLRALIKPVSMTSILLIAMAVLKK